VETTGSKVGGNYSAKKAFGTGGAMTTGYG
jgi:hypothetical protein